jgi:hypothetical protein
MQELLVFHRLRENRHRGLTGEPLAPFILGGVHQQDAAQRGLAAPGFRENPREHVAAVGAGRAAVDNQEVERLLAKPIEGPRRIGGDQDAIAVFLELGSQKVLKPGIALGSMAIMVSTSWNSEGGPSTSWGSIGAVFWNRFAAMRAT